MEVSNWDNNQLNNYIESSIHGFSEEQIKYMGWYLTNRYEEKKRATELQGDNMSYGDSHDEKGFED